MGAAEQLSQGHENQLLEVFLSGKDPKTIEAYQHDLTCFSSFLGCSGIEDLAGRFLVLEQGPANYEVLRYRNQLVDNGLSSSTINRRLATIRSMTKLARVIGLINWHVEVQNIRNEPHRDTSGPGIEAFRAMIKKVSKSGDIKSRRNHALLRVMFDLALRASELCSLKLSDLELNRDRISVKGKRDRQPRFLTISPETKAVLIDWLRVRGDHPGPLFPSLNRSSVNSPMTRQALYQIVKKYGEQANVKTRPHAIRHLSITEACKCANEAGIPLEEVLSFSRHSSVSTLMIYRDQIEDSQGKISKLLTNSLKEPK